ncbi:hypothetical protein HW452_05220 [Halomonas aquamarina]|uniref:Uncharacterized protein n=1 Tax=Vreelandella aquamarina TaxID=77097 RepID=A0ACC5VS03_9GAMM|nr:glycosyl hydrolase 108 family protein [Halomonas aquamarina]MBZ5486922.1 hypothetical protein [Halomonas aquamarina]
MATTLKQKLVAAVIDREGGYVNHPSDRGGPTNYGITQAVARSYGYTGDMRNLPRATAVRIYEARYWDSLALDSIAPISEPLAEYLFDFGVHSGPSRAGQELQRNLNVLNNRGRDFPDLVVDGAVGPKTLEGLQVYRSRRGADGASILAESINGVRIAFCRDLAERDERQEDFVFGWFRRIVELSREVHSEVGAQAAIRIYSEINASP